MSTSEAHAEAELIAEAHGNLGLDELDLSMNLDYLEFGPLDCEHVKSPIPNMHCENNDVGSQSEFCKNIGKRGWKEQTLVKMHTFI